jgi:hypothetical protein
MRLAFWQRRPWLTATVAFAIALVVGFVFAFPAALAAVCPQCFGFERLERRVYVQRGMTSEAKAEAANIIKNANERVRNFYGEQRSAARILICTSEPCYRRLRGGGSRGMAIYDRVLVLSPQGLTETIAAHELAHIELHRRVGAWKVYRDAVPTWFDEGLAVVVSDDLRYLAPAGTADRCLARTSQPLPNTLRDWLSGAHDTSLYAPAACRVHEWLTAKGGPPAAVRLAERLRAGVPFEEAYR